MLVYQLRLLDFKEDLEPVFKTKENALRLKEKYKNRNIAIKERYIDNIENDMIYRIKTLDRDGYFLEDEIFTSTKDAESQLKSPHQTIVESRLY